jgi:SpoVK/Ycf46/Vps4 family AAA+-type ATPase
LLKFDVGKVFGGIVGQSEGNLRVIMKTAEAIAPCILWPDEIEKGFSGTKSSNATDGGTSARVFGSFISWMQDRTAPVFIAATANDVTQLPPEFLRKGRFDELFFCDLPNVDERKEIWEIQIKKYGRDPKKFNIQDLAQNTDGFTGAEIEQIFIDALYAGFAKNKEPTNALINIAISETTPLSQLMKEQIKNLRDWAKLRCRKATFSEKRVRTTSKRKVKI